MAASSTLPPERYGWSSREAALAAGVSLVAAVAVVSPFFFLGTASGHDIAFHMASWLDAAGQWRQGILFPRWAEWPNYGYGEPRFIFYPPLSWLLGALLGSVLPWNAVASVFIVLVETFAGWSAYLLIRRLTDSRGARLFGAACFAANPYALLIVYNRSDFAELLAISFFPLLLAGTLTLAGSLVDENGSRRAIFAFALPFCAIWLSNAPASVIATYTAAFLFAGVSLLDRSFWPLLRGGAGMVLGFALAAFYLIPAIYEQRWVNIAGALAHGLAPDANFLYARTADAEHDLFNRVASRIAVLLLAWAGLAALAVWRSKHEGRALPRARHLEPLLATLAAVAGLLMLPLSSLAWRWLPELRFVQFPWRWMSVVALLAVVLMTRSFAGHRRWMWMLVATLAIVGSGRYLVKHTWWDTEDMPSLEAALGDGSGFEGTDEYDPLGDDHTDLPLKEPRAAFLPDGQADRKVFIESWTAERRSLRAITEGPARLAVRLLDYPAWRITVNGHTVSPEHKPGSMQMIVPVGAGESRIEIRFTRTADRVTAGVISIVAAFGSLAMLAWRRQNAAGA